MSVKFQVGQRWEIYRRHETVSVTEWSDFADSPTYFRPAMFNLLLHLLLGIFVAATCVQVVVWTGIFARLARYVPPDPKLQTQNSKLKTPTCSVIICARNEGANLRQNLPFVLEQQYPDFEVVVVDDDSSDESPAVLQAFQKKYAHLRVLRVSPKTSPGKKHALAQGIAFARSEHLVFTDADCRPASLFWLEILCARFSAPQNAKPEILLGYAPYRPAPGLLNWWIRFETVQTAMQYCAFALAGRPYMGVGRNLAWKKHLFQRAGGFAAHADLPSGDDDLFVNAAAHAGNTAICLDPRTFVYSESEKTWSAWRQQKHRHLSAGRKYRPEHQALLGALALSHTLHYFLLIPLCFSGFGTICVSVWGCSDGPRLPDLLENSAPIPRRAAPFLVSTARRAIGFLLRGLRAAGFNPFQ
ncbi:MAG: glycosyltransferase [Lewinellaceae bacterium]|nr:glycosyltransferase [Lewinellaceae bacterium]